MEFFKQLSVKDWSGGKRLILFPENLNVSLGGAIEIRDIIIEHIRLE